MLENFVWTEERTRLKLLSRRRRLNLEDLKCRRKAYNFIQTGNLENPEIKNQ